MNLFLSLLKLPAPQQSSFLVHIQTAAQKTREAYSESLDYEAIEEILKRLSGGQDKHLLEAFRVCLDKLLEENG